MRLASAVLPAVGEDGEITAPSSISQEHRELFARAQRWVSMSDADIEVRLQLLPSLGWRFARSECTSTDSLLQRRRKEKLQNQGLKGKASGKIMQPQPPAGRKAMFPSIF